MKGRFAVLAAAVAVSACAEPTAVPPVTSDLRPHGDAPLYLKGPDGVPDQYIVVFNDDVTDPENRGRGKAAALGVKVKYAYGAALKGFEIGRASCRERV